MIVKNLQGERFFINVQPIDSWTYEILGEDLMSPFFILYKCPLEIEFETYDLALSQAIRKFQELC